MISNQPGLGPESLEGNPLSGSLVALTPESYSTPLLDITQPVSAMELIPAKVGHIALAVNGTWSIESVVGVQTVPAQLQAGSDAAHINIFVSQASPSNADVNGAVPPCQSTVVNELNKVTIQPNLPVFLDITAGAQGTGGYKCMARFVFFVLWGAVA